MKAEIRDIRAEMSILSRTETILKNKSGRIDTKLKKLEEEKGISGYAETGQALEKVSGVKEDVDKSKEAVLTEISRTVKDIEDKISEKKAKLGP